MVCYRPFLSRTFQGELHRMDPLLSCEWDDGRGFWVIYRNPRVLKLVGRLQDNSCLYVVMPEPFHILTVVNSNLAEMDWRVIKKLHDIDLWRRYGSHIRQYERDLDNRLHEYREGNLRRAREELKYERRQNRAGMRLLLENYRAGRHMFHDPDKKERTRKHYSYAGQALHGYKSEGTGT